MTNPAPQTPPSPVERRFLLDSEYGPAEVQRSVDDWELNRDQRAQGGLFLQVRLIADERHGEQVVLHESELFYPAYELPEWQAQPLTLAQWLKLADLCSRYKVPFDPTDYKVWPKDGSMTKGYAEGWVGGRFGSGVNGSRNTLYVGVAPDGRSHS